ncbi:hypothetical protein KJA17_00610 [Patescibacteria group bacterium]|nr:hypothetical protein [Patescibacteria group bacterium]
MKVKEMRVEEMGLEDLVSIIKWIPLLGYVLGSIGLSIVVDGFLCLISRSKTGRKK